LPQAASLQPEESVVPQERTEAVVLRGVDFSETSRIVTFLTPGRGRLACLAKGARRRRSPFQAMLDTLNRDEIVYYWKDGREVQQLGEAALLDGFGAIKANLEKATFAALPLELALKVAHENEPSQGLYAAFVRGMESLSAWDGDIRTHACWQVAQLLSMAGFEPALDVCALCGARVDIVDAVDKVDRANGAESRVSRSAAPGWGFSYDGGATCTMCRADRRLDAAEYTALRMLVGNREACPAIRGVEGMYRVLCQYAMRQVETDLRSVRVIDEMFG
jgi:DNA repair protein RecO